MKHLIAVLTLTALALTFARATAAPLNGPGKLYSVEYPPSTVAGELPYGVNYTIWVPDGMKTVRGVIVHQHGCGTGACKGGETAAYDLHWQALARKWDCALLGPSYRQVDGQECRLWCDPRNGSDKMFLKSLHDLAGQSGHPELERAPWCLWGHSGGGYWASLMQAQYPERIAAIWFRSGTAYEEWTKGNIKKPELPAAAMGIPMMCNPGVKENEDARFRGAWTGAMSMFQAYRAQGAPIGFAPDPRTGHECGDSRYLAIPFFDACLAQRLPSKVGQPLKPVKLSSGWLAPVLSHDPQPTKEFKGKPEEAVWLPSAQVAKAWSEYVQTGATTDPTPPPAPFHVKAAAKSEGVEITWDAEADFESGLQAFVVQRDGQDLKQAPEKPVGRFGRPLFQQMSYHDTPEKPLPELRFVDTTIKPGEKHSYRVIAVNSVGLKSAPSSAVEVR